MPQSENSQYTDLDYSGMYQFQNPDDPDQEPYGSFEVFQGIEYHDPDLEVEDENLIDPDGWYWWSCFPGCLPDGDPCGPFDTSAEAYHDARGY